jgi:hypothetical protein
MGESICKLFIRQKIDIQDIKWSQKVEQKIQFKNGLKN